MAAPEFFMAPAVAGATDLLAAVPRCFATSHGGLAITEPPLPRFALKAVLPKGALADAGLAWLLAQLAGTDE